MRSTSSTLPVCKSMAESLGRSDLSSTTPVSMMRTAGRPSAVVTSLAQMPSAGGSTPNVPSF